MDFLKLVESYKDDIIKSTQEVIRIKSIEEQPKEGMPFGEGPYKALKYAVDLAAEMGFEIKEFDGYAAHADLGDGEESVGVLAHLDVVPEGDGWNHDPYGGEIVDGKIFGRGTVDDKGPAIATLYAMKALKESGVELSRKIRLILGANEETGWGCMKHYFKHEKAPTMAFVPDADFPVIYGEKGIIVFDLVSHMDLENSKNIKLIDIQGGTVANMVPDYAKAIIEVENMDYFNDRYSSFSKEYDYPIIVNIDGNKVTIEAEGISAHGSTPEKGKNAISYLMKLLGYLFDDTSSFGQFVKVYNERIGFFHNGEKIGCGFEDDISGKLNFNPGVIKLEDNKIVLTVNVRYPIKGDSKSVYHGIRENLKNTNVEVIEGVKDQKPLYVAKDNFLVQKLMKVYKEETGDYDSEPITIGGGTYARAMENAVAFGPMFPGSEDVVHQKNEYISIEDLMKLTRIYAKALYELAK